MTAVLTVGLVLIIVVEGAVDDDDDDVKDLGE